MPIQTIILTFDSINSSAQVGDIVYYSYGGSLSGGFDNTNLSNTKKLGPITSISDQSITVEYDTTLHPSGIPSSYISFVKDKKINTSSLVGYYASVKLINNSTDKAELFSIGSEISESSK